MNKIFAIIMSLFIFSSFSFSHRTFEIGMSDEEIMTKIDELSFKLDNVKRKKDKLKLYEEFAEMFYSKRAYEASMRIYLMLLEAEPPKKKEAEYYIKLGDIAASQKYYSDSLDYYKNALALYKKNNDIKKKIGEILLESNLYSLAEQMFLEILDSDKNSNYAKRKLADIYYSQKRYSKALSYYEDISKPSQDKNTIVNMAACYKSLNNPDKSIKLIEDYSKDYQSSEMFFLLGLLYSDMRKFDKGEEQFLLALRFDDKNFAAYIYLAAIYLEHGDDDKAEEMLKKASSLNSYLSAVDMMFARIAYKKGRLYEARRFASNAVLKAKSPFVKKQAQKMLDFFNEQKAPAR